MAFRDEVRAFIRDNLPAEIRERMRLGYGPRKQDTVAWQRILNKRGWAAMSWPKEWGGPGWTVGAEDDLPGGEPGRAGAGAVVVQHHHARPGADPVRHRGAEEAFPAARRQPGRLVVPGLLRAGRGIRPRVAEDRGEARRRPLRGERAEDLDLDRAPRRLVLRAGAHQSERGEAAGGHLVPAGGHEDAGHHRAADHLDRRQPSPERGVLRRRARAGGEPRLRGEPRLGRGEVPAGQRAHRHRAAGQVEGAGDGRPRRWRARCARTASR